MISSSKRLRCIVESIDLSGYEIRLAESYRKDPIIDLETLQKISLLPTPKRRYSRKYSATTKDFDFYSNQKDLPQVSYTPNIPSKLGTPRNPIIVEESSNSSDNQGEREKLTGFANWPICSDITESMLIEKVVWDLVLTKSRP